MCQPTCPDVFLVISVVIVAFEPGRWSDLGLETGRRRNFEVPIRGLETRRRRDCSGRFGFRFGRSRFLELRLVGHFNVLGLPLPRFGIDADADADAAATLLAFLPPLFATFLQILDLLLLDLLLPLLLLSFRGLVQPGRKNDEKLKL